MTPVAEHFSHPAVDRVVGESPHKLLFATMSGAHLYGFASEDSDFDVRGAHIAPLERVISLKPPRETHEIMGEFDGYEMDLVTHEAAKYIKLMLKNNGYVLEQIFSPLVVAESEYFDELKYLARGCITKNLRHHFFHFARNQWEAISNSKKPTIKKMLYTYRVLLVGIHAMRTGEIVSDVNTLNELHPVPEIGELVLRKKTGAEKTGLDPNELDAHSKRYKQLSDTLDEERERSSLPETASTRDALNDLLIRIRMSK